MLKILALACSTLCLAPAVAIAQSQETTVRVEYRDLNLKSRVGVARLDRRIGRAITEVCPNYVSGDLAARLAGIRCRRAKWALVTPQRQRVLAGGFARPANIALN